MCAPDAGGCSASVGCRASATRSAAHVQSVPCFQPVGSRQFALSPKAAASGVGFVEMGVSVVLRVPLHGHLSVGGMHAPGKQDACLLTQVPTHAGIQSTPQDRLSHLTMMAHSSRRTHIVVSAGPPYDISGKLDCPHNSSQGCPYGTHGLARPSSALHRIMCW